MPYRVELLPSAEKELAALPGDARRRIALQIDRLSENPRPHGSKGLKGGGEGLRRLRVGAYRVIYRVQDDVLLVIVVRVAHRRDVYRGR